jgi:hypothetical protein
MAWSTSAFSPGLAFQSYATGGQVTTPTITPNPQDKPKTQAIATPRNRDDVGPERA